MKVASLSGSPRGSVGKKDARELRKVDRIPAVLYGGNDQYHFHLETIPVVKLVYNPDVFKIELNLDGTVYSSIIKEIQYHPVTDKIVHIDFLQLFNDKPVTVKIPVRTVGNSTGVRNGGRLSINHRSLTLRGLPGDIPEFIAADISNLEIGEDMRVRDLKTENYEILQADSDVVVSVKRTRAAIAAAAAAAAASGAKK